VVYARSPRGVSSEQWDLFRYNLRTGRRNPFPQVNTGRNEYAPSLSGDLLLFTRAGRLRSQVVLFNRRTGRTQVLARAAYPLYSGEVGSSLDAGQVNGDFVVWERQRYSDQGPVSYNVVRYQTSTGVRTTWPVPASFGDVGPGVSADGTTYFVRKDLASPETPLQLMRSSTAGIESRPLPGAGATQLYVDDLANGSRRVLLSLRADGEQQYDLHQFIDTAE
jgi:hypothetical protein